MRIYVFIGPATYQYFQLVPYLRCFHIFQFIRFFIRLHRYCTYAYVYTKKYSSFLIFFHMQNTPLFL